MSKFVIDEDLPRSTGPLLKKLDYEVYDIRDCGLRGSNDTEIFRFAVAQRAILITGDLGFGNILTYPLKSHFGIVIAHFPNEMSTQEMNRQLINGLQELADKDMLGNLVIIEPGKIRVKK